ncbi:MAG: tetratricopeptide repeat protein [Alphaproteobacteria bacterium]
MKYIKYLALILVAAFIAAAVYFKSFDNFKAFFNKAEESVSSVETPSVETKKEESSAPDNNAKLQISRDELIKRGESGDIKSQILLGDMYRLDGTEYGFTQDAKEAFKWYKKAADQGDAFAQYNLAFLYYDGEGVEQDYKSAFEWFKKSAEQGYIEGQYNLASLYRMGRGVEANPEEAFKWLERAANQGYDQAQLAMGTLYEAGQIVDKDPMKALMWMTLLSQNGEEQTKEYLKYFLEKNTYTPEQIAEAEKLAREWKPVKEQK